MSIRGMLYNAAKYPLSGIKQLLLLGFMILLSSLLLGDYNDFYIYLQGSFGDTVVLLVLLFFISLFIIFIILEAGYTFKVIEKSVLRIDKPPEFNNFMSMLNHGIKEIIIGIIFFSVPFIILLFVLYDIQSEINLGMPAISSEIAILLFIFAFILGFISDILFKVAIPHMASKGGAFREAFNFSEIFKKIKLIGFKKLLIGYIIVVLGIVIIGGPILKEIIGSTNIYGFFVAEELLAPFLIMFAARFTALLYMESVNPNGNAPD
ncbi:MAG: DUF4013 domain-containing protein [Methanobacterium sp.]